MAVHVRVCDDPSYNGPLGEVNVTFGAIKTKSALYN